MAKKADLAARYAALTVEKRVLEAELADLKPLLVAKLSVGEKVATPDGTVTKTARVTYGLDTAEVAGVLTKNELIEVTKVSTTALKKLKGADLVEALGTKKVTECLTVK